MEYNEIKNLLDKYLAGETSAEEEKILSEYFAQVHVHADFEEWKPLFTYFSSEKNLTVSNDFDEKILTKINQKQNAIKIVNWRWISLAASFLLMLGAIGVVYKLTDKSKNLSAPIAQTNAPQGKIQDTVSELQVLKDTVSTQNVALLMKKNNVSSTKSILRFSAQEHKNADTLNTVEAKKIVEQALAKFAENWNKGKNIAMENIKKANINEYENRIIANLNLLSSTMNEGENKVIENLQELDTIEKQNNNQ